MTQKALPSILLHKSEITYKYRKYRNMIGREISSKRDERRSKREREGER